MARLPRFVLPGYPQHVIQRADNATEILRDEEDYWALWSALRETAASFECAVHAYVLMPSHYHLLLTPNRGDGISKLMQHSGRSYAQHVNRRYGRTGSIWNGRYRATLLDPDVFLLPVSNYIEANPVRAGLVRSPDAYDWSSYGANALGVEDELVSPHPAFLSLGTDAEQRLSAYADAFDPPRGSLLQRIRDATNKAWALGDDAFCDRVEALSDRRTRPQRRGGDRRSDSFRSSVGQRSR
jgi:putative transposase